MEDSQFRTYIYLIVSNVIPLIMENQNVSEIEAITDFYQSETYALLEQEESKFWWMSPRALYEDYMTYGKEEAPNV